VAVNALLKLPRSPGPHVTLERCVCGATYDGSHFGVCWKDGTVMVRAMNGEAGGFRSKGAVLWAMRFIKTKHWFSHHAACGEPTK
jgi:hypothetical protein